VLDGSLIFFLPFPAAGAGFGNLLINGKRLSFLSRVVICLVEGSC